MAFVLECLFHISDHVLVMQMPLPPSQGDLLFRSYGFVYESIGSQATRSSTASILPCIHAPAPPGRDRLLHGPSAPYVLIESPTCNCRLPAFLRPVSRLPVVPFSDTEDWFSKIERTPKLYLLIFQFSRCYRLPVSERTTRSGRKKTSLRSRLRQLESV